MPEPTDETAAERDDASASPPGTADGEEPAAAPVEADLERLASERDDMRALAQQLQADFENYKKQMLRRQTEQMERATERLLEQLLPVLDSFELALGAVASADEQVRKGVELVFAELMSVLEKHGLARIDALHEPFDPTEHEAVMQDDGDGEPVVTEVMRTGYRLKGRVLRPSMVKVAR